jgi:hypothetical protein
MGEVTHAQADLMLKLYDMRREPRLREARDWYVRNFHPASVDDVYKTMAGPESGSLRMVISYWEMCANMVNRGLIDEEFFFENTGEQWLIWERIKAFVPTMRERSKNPHQFGNLEKHVAHMEAWREKRAPGSAEAQRKMMAQMLEASRARTAGD